MRYHVFESGSKGNATLITSNDSNILIDNGLSKKTLVLKLSETIQTLMVKHILNTIAKRAEVQQLAI